MTGPAWSTACPDWERRIVEGRPLVPFPPLFPESAVAGMRVLDELRIFDMPGSPRFGDVSREWVRSFCEAVFGAYDPETGRRMVREFFLLISKKNGKSTTAGLLMLAILLLNWRTGGEFGILAPTLEVAKNAYDPAAAAVKADPELLALLHVQDHIRTITHRTTGGKLQVVAADSETVAGKKWAVTLVDELWLFGKRANAEDMLREATGGLASRPEGAVIWLSTQSDEPPAGVFRQKLMYARGVRDGRINDPEFLPVLYEHPPSMIEAGEHLRPENFRVTNPNLGSSVDEAYLRREVAKATETGEDTLRGVLAKNLNVEIGLALGTDRWAGASYWERQGLRAGLTLEQLIERSDVAVVGIDGGGLDDLLGLCVLGRERETGTWLAWTRAWAQPSALQRHKQLVPRFHDFARDGDLVLAKREGEDVSQVAEVVLQVYSAGLLPEKDAIGVDPHGIADVLEALNDAQVPAELVTGINQGWRLTGAIKTCERKLAYGGLKHGGTPMMAWCAGNARVEARGNAVVITKQGSGAAKIDPLIALFIAATLLALNPAGVGRSWWDAQNAVAG